MAFDGVKRNRSINYSTFMNGKVRSKGSFTYVSLFSGAGIGDYGLKLAGGKCLAACEIDGKRRLTHTHNIKAPIFGDIRTEKEALISAVIGTSVDLLIATPPCQSFSSANAKRGKINDARSASNDPRNHLFFQAITVINAIKPRVVIFENVPNFLGRSIYSECETVKGTVAEFMDACLGDYISWKSSICFSKLGIPQYRKRAIAIYVLRQLIPNQSRSFDLACKELIPENWTAQLAGTPATLIDAISSFPALDGKSEKLATSSDILHSCPIYSDTHYSWIKNIPKMSGKSAWENKCTTCGNSDTPPLDIDCTRCGSKILTRPHISENNGNIRAIKGFKSSYKRMNPFDKAPTITTSSGHFSSDIKLHPTQNRVLSARECAALQTIPSSFKWPKETLHKKGYIVREMIGEAIPPAITFRFGRSLTLWLEQQRLQT